MDQLTLFRPPELLLAELHSNVSHMNLKAARACQLEYENSWRGIGLTWEPSFLDFWTVNGLPGDPDEGWSLWLKLQQTDFWSKLPLSVRLGFQTNYFQKILDDARDVPETRSPEGISIGYLHFLAGRLDSGLALLQKEAAEAVDDPLPHLYLGNTQYLLTDAWEARASYRDALLRDLKRNKYPEILDVEVRAFLAEVEANEWAVIEACIRGVLPVTRVRSVSAVPGFLEKHSWLTTASSCPPPSPIRQFYACLVISESRTVFPEDALLKARLHMKFLNGRLHRPHMETLDTKGPTI